MMNSIRVLCHFFVLIFIRSSEQMSLQVSPNNRDFLESPCPNIFEYQYDNNGQLHGVIEVSPTGETVQLNVELSVGNRVEGYNGQIELAYSKPKVIDNLMNKRPILYRVYFPAWQGIPPKVTKISVNGNVICTGPKISIGLVPVLTTINLQHVLRLNVSPLNSVPSSSTPDNNDNLNPDFDIRKYEPNSSGGTKFAQTDTNGNQFFAVNPINFNPTKPKDGTAQIHVISFDPQKVPSQYAGNPFLNGIGNSQSDNDFVDLIKNQNIPGLFDTRTTTQSPIINFKPMDVTERNNRNPIHTIDFKPPATQSTNKKESDKDVNFPVLDFPTRKTGSSGSTGGSQPFNNECGLSIATNSLIINGSPIVRGAYPWLVALFGNELLKLEYRCSGTLISDRHVVTAAHCVQKNGRKMRPSQLLMVLGKINIQRWTQNSGLMIDPEEVHIHPDYDVQSADADIAVLILSEPAKFTKFIRPICLWSGSSQLETVVGQLGTVVGWGKDENGGDTSEEPKQISLPIVSQERCLRSSQSFHYITSNRTFCAGFRNGTGPCNGDSGSGFIMQRNGRWELRGVVSMSISDTHRRTCDLSNYVVFTDAGKYLNWLLNFIR